METIRSTHKVLIIICEALKTEAVEQVNKGGRHGNRVK